MTGMDKDPFERLSQITTPEPDPAKVRAVAAMSARAFADQARSSKSIKETGWLSRWLKREAWLFPVSAMAFTLAAVALLVPLIGRPQMVAPLPDTAPPPGPVADARPAGEQPGQVHPPQEEGIRMGAVPPRSNLPPLDLRDDAVVRTYSFDGVEIVMRSAPEEVALYVVEGGSEHWFDRRFKEPGQEITLTDAFLQENPRSGTLLLLLRSGHEGMRQQWDVFVDTGEGYRLSGALTNLVHDAANRAEVIARLEGAIE